MVSTALECGRPEAAVDDYRGEVRKGWDALRRVTHESHSRETALNNKRQDESPVDAEEGDGRGFDRAGR